jgi:hypothetical protein
MVGLTVFGPQLVPGSGEGQNTRNKSIVGAEADRQSTAKVAGSHRHSISRVLFRTRGLVTLKEMTLRVRTRMVPVRRQV